MAKRQRATAPVGYDPSDYPPFAVTVDVVILTLVDGELQVVLIRRSADPHQGAWALPGGFKRPDETLDEAAARELVEETGVDAAAHLSQLGAYGDPGRDPRMNVVTVAYLAVLRDVGALAAGGDADDVRLWPVSKVLGRGMKLAFDHRRIVRDAVERASGDLETTSLATAFVGPEFTLRELRSVYEAVWDTKLDPANFRRSLLASDAVEPTGVRSQPGDEGGRPPELYRAAPSLDRAATIRKPRSRSQENDPNARPRTRPST